MTVHERRVRDDAYSLVLAVCDHLLFLDKAHLFRMYTRIMPRKRYLCAIQKRVLDLHTDKLRPPVAFSSVVHFGKLPHAETRGANVSYFACHDKLVKRPHGLLKRGGSVKSVYLENINVRCLESAQGGVDLIEDGCP